MITQAHNHTIGCCVDDSYVDPIRKEVDTLTSAQVVDLTIEQLVDTHGPDVDSVIYDLRPWNELAFATVRSLVERSPQTPLLLYITPNAPDVGYLLGRAARLDPHILLAVCTNETSLDAALRDKLLQLLNSVPTQVAYSRFRETFPDIAAETRDFIYEIATALNASHPVPKHPRVENLARRLHIASRTLERMLKKDRLPAPKKLIMWFHLTFLTLLSEEHAQSIPTTARHFGVNPQALHRMRHVLADFFGIPRRAVVKATTDELYALMARWRIQQP